MGLRLIIYATISSTPTTRSTGSWGCPKSALRQNDFGGTLGGPIIIPHTYNGKDKTFFFFSYEGLRLLQPQAATVQYVPDINLRASAPPPLRQVLNAFPLPNCTNATPNCTNPGNGLAGFVGSWSNPSTIDAKSVRLDHSVNDRVKLFFSASVTHHQPASRPTGFFASPAELFLSNYAVRTYTLGGTTLVHNHFSNELRLNYSSNAAARTWQIDGFAGGQAVDLRTLQGVDTRSNPAYSCLA